jgi:hypothetical protein
MMLKKIIIIKKRANTHNFIYNDIFEKVTKIFKFKVFIFSE